MKHQFDVLVHETVGAESIEDIFDVQFGLRFAELINRTAERNNPTGHIDWFRR